MGYKEKFEEIARKYIKRDGLAELLESLAKSDFYTAPASTRFHDSVESGLVFHSLKVFHQLFTDEECKGVYDMETIAIVTLFHDLCKVGFYTTEMRNSKENGKWVKVPYYTVDDKFPIGHGSKSVILLMEHMKLTYDEILAINHHMGAYGLSDYMALNKAMTDCKLVTYLQFADIKATYF